MMTTTIENTAASIASRFISNTNKNVFLTGRAGTGKTTFLKHIIRHTYKNAMIVAPTGIAAINAGGVTIHSLFQLPFGAFIPVRGAESRFSEYVKIHTPDTLFKNLQLSGTKRRLLQELELLIIDEVSMLRADLLDAIDLVLKSIRRKSHLPFGGVQVLFIGDLLQLPPVVKEDEWKFLRDHYRTAFFFDAQVLQQNKPLYIELDKIYRQADDVFIRILNNLRSNHITARDIEMLNTRYQEGFRQQPGDNYIYLTTHNYKADNLNRESLQRLEGASFFFKAETSGDFSEYTYPVEQNLELKKNAQIMFIKNDPTGAQRFFNGKIGTVSDISSQRIEVSFNDGSKPVSVEKYEWQNIRYTLNEATNEIEEKVNGTFTQYPVRLAWAITVHKSQGLTFSKAIVDIGDAFAPGQVYVALSRLTSLEGLVLSSRINTGSLHVDQSITDYSNTKDSNDALAALFEKEAAAFFRSYVTGCFNFSELSRSVKRHLEDYQKEGQKSTRQKYFTWAQELQQDTEAAKVLADKFLNQLHFIFENRQPDYKEQLKTRVEAAKNHFEPLLKKLSGAIQKQIESLKTEKKVKAYLQELAELDTFFFRQLQLIGKAGAMVRSATENAEFTRDNIQSSAANRERIEALNAAPAPKEKDRKEKGQKKEKGTSQRLSYELHKQGKSIEEIAGERNLSVVTIENHLAEYVGLGLIDIGLFVEEEKRNNIITVSKTLNTTSLGPLKQALPDEYSYPEIRFTMAFYANSKK